MHKYKVTFEVCYDPVRREDIDIVVEAGNRKLAIIRAIQKLGEENPQVINLYKKVKTVDFYRKEV